VRRVEHYPHLKNYCKEEDPNNRGDDTVKRILKELQVEAREALLEKAYHALGISPPSRLPEPFVEPSKVEPPAPI
jgi:hypothetical protein